MAVGTNQGVAGLAPRPFTLGEETGSHDMVMCIAPAEAHLRICRPVTRVCTGVSVRATSPLLGVCGNACFACLPPAHGLIMSGIDLICPTYRNRFLDPIFGVEPVFEVRFGSRSVEAQERYMPAS